MVDDYNNCIKKENGNNNLKTLKIPLELHTTLKVESSKLKKTIYEYTIEVIKRGLLVEE